MKKLTLVFIVILVFAFTLRVYKLSDFPPGLYSDEAAFGYNAYSLLITGHDEYGKTWPMTLKSFGDYKPPMTAWLTIPSIAIFGLNEFAIRLPSAIAGTLTVGVVYFLLENILLGSKIENVLTRRLLSKVPLVASLLLAISPWHLLFSRSSMLVGIELFFICTGLLFFLKSLKKSIYLIYSAIFFDAAVYTYYGSRLTVPLILIGLLLIFKNKLWEMRKTVLAALTVGLCFLVPLITSIFKDPETLTGRAKTVSVFYDAGIDRKLWEAHTLDGQLFPVVLSRFFHNKPYFYFWDILRRYSQHFSIDFLFISGDKQPPFNIPNMGVTYFFDGLFFMFGLYLVIRFAGKKTSVLVLYLFLSAIAASLTFVTPSANRSFGMVIGLTCLSALGIFYATNKLSSKLNLSLGILFLIITFIYIDSFYYYMHNYWVVALQINPEQWHYGENNLVKDISRLDNNYSQIIISDKGGPSYIWLLLYKKYDPREYWSSVRVNYDPDQYGFIHTKSFDKYVFLRSFEWDNIEKKTDILYVGFEEEIPDNWVGVQNTAKLRVVIDNKIYYLNGATAFKIVHLENI